MQHCASVSASTRVYIKWMSVQVGYVLEKWGQTLFFFFLSLCLWPQSYGLASRPLPPPPRPCRFPPAYSCHQKGLREVFICRAPAFRRLDDRSYGLLTAPSIIHWWQDEVSILVPKRVQTEVKVDGNRTLDGSHYFWAGKHTRFFHMIDSIFSSY